jgi:hypothetical protein
VQFWKGCAFIAITIAFAACANSTPESSLHSISRQIHLSCEQLGYATPDTGQVGFSGVYPGITLAEEVPSLLGEPTEVTRSYSHDYIHWDYPGFDLFLDKDGVVVDRIEVWDGDFGDLNSLLTDYGCPDEILQTGAQPCDEASDDEECPAQLTVLVYKQLGLEASLSEVQVSANSEVIHLTFDDLQQVGERNRDWYTAASWLRVFRSEP